MSAMMSDHGRAQDLCCNPFLIETVCLVRRKAILLDFFRHAFDGSGADNFVSALHLLRPFVTSTCLCHTAGICFSALLLKLFPSYLIFQYREKRVDTIDVSAGFIWLLADVCVCSCDSLTREAASTGGSPRRGIGDPRSRRKTTILSSRSQALWDSTASSRAERDRSCHSSVIIFL